LASLFLDCRVKDKIATPDDDLTRRVAEAMLVGGLGPSKPAGQHTVADSQA